MSYREIQEERLRELGLSDEEIEAILADFVEPPEVPDADLETRRYEYAPDKVHEF